MKVFNYRKSEVDSGGWIDFAGYSVCIARPVEEMDKGELFCLILELRELADLASSRDFEAGKKEAQTEIRAALGL